MNRKIINVVMIFCILLFLLGIAGVAFEFANLASYIVGGVSAVLFLMCLKIRSKIPM